MEDTSNIQHTIKQIIFWLRQIQDYKDIIAFIDYNPNSKGKIVEKPRNLVAKIISQIGVQKEVELSDEALIKIYNVFKGLVEHLENLVAESDPQLVEIAKGIYNGEITPEGLKFK